MTIKNGNGQNQLNVRFANDIATIREDTKQMIKEIKMVKQTMYEHQRDEIKKQVNQTRTIYVAIIMSSLSVLTNPFVMKLCSAAINICAGLLH